MTTTLESVFQALGYTGMEQQRDLIKLLQASGAFGELPGVTGTLDDRQAMAILKSVTFDDTTRAADWLHDVTQEYMPTNAIARQIDVGFPKLLETLKTQAAAPPQLVLLDPADIKVDADTYQFRSGGDKKGVNEKRRSNISQWDWGCDGAPVLVHYCDGKYNLVDGHHRLAKALELNAKGAGPGKIAAIVLGPEYSKLDAKIAGAYKNMLHDLADARDVADAAKAFKEAEKAHQALLPKVDVTQGDLAIAYNLKDVPPENLDKITGEVTNRLADPGQQKAAMRILSTELGALYKEPPNWSLEKSNPSRPLVQPTAYSSPGMLASLQQKRADPASIVR